MSYLVTSSDLILSFFFFNDTATTEIYTLSLHDALPICAGDYGRHKPVWPRRGRRLHRRSVSGGDWTRPGRQHRSEEHTSELQSRLHLVCRLLLEKKKYPPHLSAPLDIISSRIQDQDHAK